MNSEQSLHESDLRAQIAEAFPTEGAIQFLSLTLARGKEKNRTKMHASGPTDLPEHFPWPRAEVCDGAGAHPAG